MDALPTLPPVAWLLIGKGLAILFLVARLANRNSGAPRTVNHARRALRKGATVREWKRATFDVQHSSAMMWAESLQNRGIIHAADHTDFAAGLATLINDRLESPDFDGDESRPVHEIGWEILQRRRLIADKTREAEKVVQNRPAFLPDGAMLQDWLVASEAARLATTLLWVERLRGEGMPVGDGVALAQVVRDLTDEQVGDALEYAPIDTPLFLVSMKVLTSVRLAVARQILETSNQ